MNFVDLELKQKIMATDIYVAVASQTRSHDEIHKDIVNVVKMLQRFDNNFNRFSTTNELAKLNNATALAVSDEMMGMLVLAKDYFQKTAGVFEPSILPSLVSEGYNQSFKKGLPGKKQWKTPVLEKYNFGMVQLDESTHTVVKPSNLKIDLGGIGKGYILDKAVEFLQAKYANYCIEAGGDMYLAGIDSKQKYPYWAIEIENPFVDRCLLNSPTLLVSNQAIATSGVNRRKWLAGGIIKNHLIDPASGRSIQGDLETVTVIGNSTVYCDIMAKVIVIKGLNKGLEYCNSNQIPAILIAKDGKIHSSESALKYVWKA